MRERSCHVGRMNLAPVVLLVACGGSKRDDADCAAAVAPMRALSFEAVRASQLSGSHEQEALAGVEANIRLFEQAVLTECNAGWTREVRNCYANASSATESQVCDRQLTPAQAARMGAAIKLALSQTDLGKLRTELDTELAAMANQPPVECLEYQNEVTRTKTCVKLAKTERDKLTTDLATFEVTWAHADKVMLANDCKSKATAIHAQLDGVGCKVTHQIDD